VIEELLRCRKGPSLVWGVYGVRDEFEQFWVRLGIAWKGLYRFSWILSAGGRLTIFCTFCSKTACRTLTSESSYSLLSSNQIPPASDSAGLALKGIYSGLDGACSSSAVMERAQVTRVQAHIDALECLD
jgi:hypothetical protein